MSVQQTLKAWAMGIVAIVVLVLLAPPLLAKDYKQKDLKGTYHFTVTESRVEAGEIQYCDSYGSISFDGQGHADRERRTADRKTS